MRLKIAILGELTQIALSCSSIETKVINNLFGGDFIPISRIFYNIDQFLGQNWFYRPFSAPAGDLSTIFSDVMVCYALS